MSEPVELTVADGIARVTLTGFGGNAIAMALAVGLRHAVRQAVGLCEEGRVRVVVISAVGSAFCVGGDLGEFAAATDRSAHVGTLAAVMHETIGLLDACPVPVVSVVQGVVAGGGLGIALAADIVVMAHEASMVMAYTAVGLTPDCGVSWKLSRLLSGSRALDFALTNRRLTGSEAEAWGLVSRSVPRADLAAVALAMVKRLSAGPAEAFVRTKRLLRSADQHSLASHLEQEAACIACMAGTAEGVEGVDAFLDKRKPMF